MEILMFIGTAYAVLYVMWLLVAVVCGHPERWWNVSLFFLFIPFAVAFICAIMLISAFVSPLYFFFSREAREEFKQKMKEQGL